jgi:hypothetical protein
MDKAYVGVAPCTLTEPVVPSSVVQCGKCSADCWLSLKTGESVIEAAKQLGPYGGFMCLPCLFETRLTDLVQ